jgi:acetyl-CoA carboxylase biotin carboxyl carrier protein
MEELQKFRQLAAWLAETDIGLLELSGPRTRLRLRRDGSGAGEVVQADASDGPARKVELKSGPDVVSAASVGVFLHRHPQSEMPLAADAAHVRAGQTVGLLRVGQLLLPVHAPRDGAIARVLAAHGAVVGYGDPLLELV